jgi:hypothetical protein
VKIAIVLAALALLAGAALQDHPKKWQLVPTQHKFTGVAGCAMCHDGRTQTKSHGQWAKGPHARAYQTLGSDKAKAIAKERGIDDPQKSADCLKCHTTGYGNEPKWFDKEFTLVEGVSCETCHGAGYDYLPKAVHGKDRAKAIAKGLVIPTEGTCRNCHNEESPTWKEHGFNYKEFRKKIMHWTPKEIDK